MRLGPVVVTDTRWLWLLVPAVLLVALDLARGWGSRGQRVRGALVRLLVLATLAVALTDPRWERRRPSAHVIFVVDRSASMSEAGVAAALARAKELAATLGPDVRTGLVLSDGSPSVAVMPGQPWSVSEVPRGDKVESTDLGAALDLARALVPAGDSGQIVLLSDGRPTAGERRTTALAPRLGAAGAHHRHPARAHRRGRHRRLARRFERAPGRDDRRLGGARRRRRAVPRRAARARRRRARPRPGGRGSRPARRRRSPSRRRSRWVHPRASCRWRPSSCPRGRAIPSAPALRRSPWVTSRACCC
ncbi:MAG: VWA domain-containing protein [Polyangiaceae bacterium]|nr:VWA domain-containing protein [Polyangiaceae bacterium]